MLGSLNRAQQAHYFDNQTFADDFATLELGIDEETDNYRYTMENHGDHVFHFAEAKKESTKRKIFSGGYRLRHFIGAVFEMKDRTTGRVRCELDFKENIPNFSFSNFLPSLENNVPTCHPDTEEL